MNQRENHGFKILHLNLDHSIHASAHRRESNGNIYGNDFSIEIVFHAEKKIEKKSILSFKREKKMIFFSLNDFGFMLIKYSCLQHVRFVCLRVRERGRVCEIERRMALSLSVLMNYAFLP